MIRGVGSSLKEKTSAAQKPRRSYWQLKNCKAHQYLMRSQKVVTLAKAGGHGYHNHLEKLDSGFRRNVGK
jgi:hypothetical protein